jgi:hypothetical protein
MQTDTNSGSQSAMWWIAGVTAVVILIAIYLSMP